MRPKHGQESEKQGEPCPKQQCIQPPTYEKQKAFIEGIQQLESIAAIVAATMIQLSTPALPNVPRLPKMIIYLYYLKYSQMSHDELMAECERVFQSKLAVTREEAKYLAQSTILQSQCLSIAKAR